MRQVEQWESFGEPGESFHIALVPYAGHRYTILKDDHDHVLVYDEHEWSCFKDGVKSGEFDT